MNARAAFPSPALVRREQNHRRAVVLGLAVLLVLATSPLVGHHVPIGLDQHFAGRDHLWALCLVALHGIMAPVHGVFHLLFAAGLAYALWDRARAWRAQRAALRALPVRRPTADDAFGRAAAAVGLEAGRLRIVYGLPTPAFTAGWLRPRVYAAAGLARQLRREELEAVLAHEAAHVRRGDPLRLSLLRFLGCMLFWLPAVGRLADDIADEAEVRADDDAARGRPLALAAAIVTLAQWHRPAPAVHDGVGFDERDLLERRVRRLAGDDVPPRSRVTRRCMFAAALALALAWSSGAVMAHPLPADVHAHDPHCEHDGTSALRHLFCLGQAALERRADCPHR